VIKTRRWITLSLVFLFIFGITVVYFSDLEIAYTPSNQKRLNGSQAQTFSAVLEKGGVAVTPEMLELGRKVFYEETFGNEVFLTDILGIVGGALTVPNMTKAILQLRGEGTTNLRVELAETVVLGGKKYEKGSKIDTGIDVPKGAFMPLGMPVSISEGKVKVGISCAACHATVDPVTKLVNEGAPNNDLNQGLMLALASNSAAYFTHAEIDSLQNYIMDLERTVISSTGEKATLPSPQELEKAVDAIFSQWPAGNFDSTIDMKANPSQIPDSFTKGDHPYGWSGMAMAGPFQGLSAFSNNVHAQNSDSLSQADVSEELFGIDKEVYLGTILQNAADPRFRYSPNKGDKPSKFFASVDPTPGVAGVNELVLSPTFPRVSLVAIDGLLASSNGSRVWEEINSVSAWQNTLSPPANPKEADMQVVQLGEAVYRRAGCISCHAGDFMTNNRVIPAPEIGTQPSRAKAFKKTQKIFGESYLYSQDTLVPLPDRPEIMKVPTRHLDLEQIKLAFAHGDSPGGYKVPSLIGLYWSAPYLHDGGVAVGANPLNDLGIPGTLNKGISPDPYQSLKALVDKELREKVVSANKKARLDQVGVLGSGHSFWVDTTTDFTAQEQQALIEYLLSQNQMPETEQ
jgi:hypothetical protein